MPTLRHTQVFTFADDTAILFTHERIKTATLNLQNHLKQIEDLTEKNKIKINSTKRWSLLHLKKEANI